MRAIANGMEGNTAPEKKKKDWTIPVSIVVAGIFVAFAVVYNIGKPSSSTVDVNNAAGRVGEIIIPPVTPADHIEGNANAPIKIVEYSDLECPFCKDFHATLNNVISIYGDQVALIYRHFPLAQLHPKAPAEAQAAECAYKLGGNNAFFSYIDQVFSVTPSNNGLDPAELPRVASQIGLNAADFNACLGSDYGQALIQREYNDAVQSGGQGTPYTIIMNSAGKKYVMNEAQPLDRVRAVIDQAIKENL